MTDTIITVEGRFDSHHPAERGTASVSVGFEGPEREDVVRRTAALHGKLAEEAERLRSAEAVGRWSADRLRAWSDRPWNQDGEQLPLVHHAAVSLEVEFADLAELAHWVERVAAREGCTVTGIAWTLTESTRARITAEAQHRAVEDALARATAYARSLGLGTVRPLAIADPGMLGDASGPDPAAGGAPMARAMAAAADGLELKPAEITVSSRAHARFAAS